MDNVIKGFQYALGATLAVVGVSAAIITLAGIAVALKGG